MLFYFSLGILILTFGASLFWRRSFGISRSEYGRISPRIFANSFFCIVSRRISRYLASMLFKTNKLKLFKYIFITAVILIEGMLSYQSYQQFQVWSQNEVSKFLLPPHQNISYFIFYAGARFFAPYLISLAVALIFLFLAQKLNKKYQERFFYLEEPYFGAIAIFLTGHPGWLFYLVILIFIYLVLHLSLVIGQLSIVKGNRISLYYLWLPTGIFVIIISKWLESLPLWSLLKI